MVDVHARAALRLQRRGHVPRTLDGLETVAEVRVVLRHYLAIAVAVEVVLVLADFNLSEAALAELRKPLLRVRYPDFCAEERAYHRRGDRRAVRRFEQMARREVSAPRTSDEMYLRRAYRRDHRVQLLDVSLGNPQRFFAGVRLVVASYLVVEVHRPVLRDTLRHRLEGFLVASRPAVDVERRDASLSLLAVNVERDEASRYIYEMMLR